MKVIWLSLTLFAIVASIPQALGIFDRTCSNVLDCEYSNEKANSVAYFACKSGKCVCETDLQLAGARGWTTTLSGSECLIAKTGPCGPNKDGNMELGCADGSTCIEGRCRVENEVGTMELNQRCEETIDCKSGLKCKVVAFRVGPVSECLHPDTPGLPGYEN